MIEEYDRACHMGMEIKRIAELLFDSLMNKLNQFPELNTVISRQLFEGRPIAYAADDAAVRNALMFGFVRVKDSMGQIANRIFEVRLYNRFLLNCKEQNSEIYAEGLRQKNQFIMRPEIRKEWI